MQITCLIAMIVDEKRKSSLAVPTPGKDDLRGWRHGRKIKPSVAGQKSSSADDTSRGGCL